MSLVDAANILTSVKDQSKYNKSLLNKTVNIQTVDGKNYIGQIFVIDPVSQTVVIVNKASGESKIHILLGHAIKSMRICEEIETKEIFLNETTPATLQNEDIIAKKEMLKSWLHKHFINVEEDNMLLKLGDDLVIEPPYDIHHCYSSNTIILERVQNILSQVPIP